MDALRNHPFFKPINWKTLWTEDAPLIEPGLVTKEPQPSNVSIRLAWDQIDAENAIEDDDEDDAVSWTSNGEGGDYFPNVTASGNGHAEPEPIGPYGERRTHTLAPIPLANVEEESGSPADGVRFVSPAHSHPSIPEDELRDKVKDILDPPIAARSQPINVPRATGPGSHSTGSASSSSDGSPVDKMSAMDEAARVRPRAQTPIQGNGLLDPELYVRPHSAP